MSSLYQLRKHPIILLFILVVVIGSVVRLVSLGSSVSTLNRDEAALAYNAYLLKEAGVDEWGVKWPLTLQSFGDYKLIGYPATLSVLFRLLPPSDTVTRLPSALAGIGLLIVSYFFGKQFGLRTAFSVVFTLVIAIAPVFIFFSRFAYEANVALLFVVTALLLWLCKAQSQKSQFFLDIIGIGLFTAACFTYNAPYILFTLCVAIVVLSRLSKGWRSWLPVLLLFGLSYAFISWQLLPVLQQKSGISIFTDATVLQEYGNYRQSLPVVAQPLLGNQYVYWTSIMLRNMLSSYSPIFLVIRPLHPWHGVPGWGQLLWPIGLLGWGGVGWLLVVNLRQVKRCMSQKSSFVKLLSQSSVYLLLFLLISLAPAVITVDAPHATRSLLFLYLFSLLAIIFLQHVSDIWQKKYQTRHIVLKIMPVLAFLLLLLATSLAYLSQLFFTYPKLAVSIFQSGFQQVIQESNRQSTVAIVDPGGYQYILLAWYLLIPPKEYLASNTRQMPDKIGFRYGERVGKFHFIAEAADRSASESALVQWESTTQSWRITQ